MNKAWSFHPVSAGQPDSRHLQTGRHGPNVQVVRLSSQHAQCRSAADVTLRHARHRARAVLRACVLVEHADHVSDGVLRTPEAAQVTRGAEETGEGAAGLCQCLRQQQQRLGQYRQWDRLGANSQEEEAQRVYYEHWHTGRVTWRGRKGVGGGGWGGRGYVEKEVCGVWERDDC